MKINHGSKVRDKVTGFTGIVTGHADYITGCDQYLVQPVTNPKGEWVDSRWFDDQRLEVLIENIVSLGIEDEQTVKPGADKPAPIK